MRAIIRILYIAASVPKVVVARVRMGGGNCMKQAAPHSHAVAYVAPILDKETLLDYLRPDYAWLGGERGRPASGVSPLLR